MVDWKKEIEKYDREKGIYPSRKEMLKDISRQQISNNPYKPYFPEGTTRLPYSYYTEAFCHCLEIRQTCLVNLQEDVLQDGLQVTRFCFSLPQERKTMELIFPCIECRSSTGERASLINYVSDALNGFHTFWSLRLKTNTVQRNIFEKYNKLWMWLGQTVYYHIQFPETLGSDIGYYGYSKMHIKPEGVVEILV